VEIKNLQKFSKCYKNKKITKLASKKVLSHENRWKNALFIANYVILRFFCARPKFFKNSYNRLKKCFDHNKKYLSYDIE
jgi:hypothetical protein